MAVLDKITKTAQDVVRSTKDLTDTVRQNSLISDEQKKIASLYSQIGKIYYETQDADPETTLGKLCLTIDASNDRIAAYNEEIRKIKGAMRCQSCGADIPITSTFCGVCGTKTKIADVSVQASETSKKYSPGCGMEIRNGITFCTSCGQRQ